MPDLWHNLLMGCLSKPRFERIRVSLILMLLGLFAGMSLSASAAEERTLTLQESARKQPFTSVVINGVETSALIDTGATIALIEHRFIPPEDSLATEDNQVRILGIGGAREYPIATLSSLQAGAEYWSGLRVAVNAKDQFPVTRSVIPISIFDTRVVDFDFRNQQVHFYDRRPKRIREGFTSSIKYEDINDLIFVPVEINGTRGTALIDTGADVSFVNEAFAKLSRGKLDEHRTKIIQGSDLSRVWASIHSFRRLEIGDHGFDRLTLPVVSTDLFTELGFVDEPMMVLGMDLLHHFRMQVDRRRTRVTFVYSEKARWAH